MKPKAMLLLSHLLVFSTSGWSAEDKEEKITIDQLPAAVKETLLKAANGATLTDFERDTVGGKVYYCADIPGSTKDEYIEFTVTENGKLVRTETCKDDAPQESKSGK